MLFDLRYPLSCTVCSLISWAVLAVATNLPRILILCLIRIKRQSTAYGWQNQTYPVPSANRRCSQSADGPFDTFSRRLGSVPAALPDRTSLPSIEEPTSGRGNIPSFTKSWASLTKSPSHPFATTTSTETGNHSSCCVMSLHSLTSPHGEDAVWSLAERADPACPEPQGRRDPSQVLVPSAASPPGARVEEDSGRALIIVQRGVFRKSAVFRFRQAT